MEKKTSIENKKTVIRSLKAPASLAERIGNEEPSNRFRSTFMRDRDRVLYSAPFRLLAGKTQVYITGIDDNMRTRLTHTLEVAQIAKTIAAALRLDVDLVEAIALGHDIGHTPYGHAGERILHEIMNPKHNHPIKGSPCDLESEYEILDFIKNHTEELGFKHNLHSVEVALSEAKRTENQSLSLTNFTLYGMCAHSSLAYKRDDKDIVRAQKEVGYYNQFCASYSLNGHDAWSFEAYVVEEADEIAQRHHDLEDAIRGNLLSAKEVYEQIKHCFKDYFNRNDMRMLNSMKSLLDKNQSLYYAKLSKLIVNMLVTRLIKCSIHNLNQFIEDNKITEAKFKEHIQRSDGKQERSLIGYDFLSDGDRPFYTSLNSFKTAVSNQVLGAYDIQRADAKGVYIIRKIIQALYSTPQQLPNECLIDYCLAVSDLQYKDVVDRISKEGIGKLREEYIKDMKNAQKCLDVYKSDPDRDKPDEEAIDAQRKLIALMRAICNYIAGMTDHTLQAQYQDLYG